MLYLMVLFEASLVLVLNRRKWPVEYQLYDHSWWGIVLLLGCQDLICLGDNLVQGGA